MALTGDPARGGSFRGSEGWIARIACDLDVDATIEMMNATSCAALFRRLAPIRDNGRMIVRACHAGPSCEPWAPAALATQRPITACEQHHPVRLPF